MRFESVWAVYFSACGSTRRVLRAMAKSGRGSAGPAGAGADHTLPPARNKPCLWRRRSDILGSPTYAGRLPNAAALFAGALYRRGRGGRGGGTVRQPRL